MEERLRRRKARTTEKKLSGLSARGASGNLGNRPNFARPRKKRDAGDGVSHKLIV